MRAYFSGLHRYVDFSGRMSRSHYWQFVLCSMAAVFVGIIIDYGRGHHLFAEERLGLFAILIALGHFLPWIAASVRRMHDSDNTGWLYWLVYIPVVGWIPFFILVLLPSTPGLNKYDVPVGTVATPGKSATAHDARSAEADGFKSPMFGHYQRPPRQEPTMQPASTRASVAPAGPDAPVRPVAGSPAGSSAIVDQLERLAALKASGAIDEAEFASMKARLLMGETK